MVLASAALERLKLNNRVSNYFDDEQMLNAPGQGAIAVETRSEGAVKDIVASLDHKKTRFCISQERLFLKTLMGGCTSPIGAYCNIENNFIKSC